MRIGKLRHYVTIKENKVTQDATTGEMISGWQQVAKVWAQIVPMSARDFLAANAAQSEVRGRIVIRYRDDVVAGQRVEYRGKYYRVIGVMEDDRSMQEHLTLMVAEGVRLEQ